MKVSTRTYEDEMRRRNESKPVQIIDCSKLQESASKSTDESIDKPIDKSNKPIKEKTNLLDYVCILI